MTDLGTRAVLVTGAAGGIGRASVLELAARGFRVFAGVRTQGDAQALAGMPQITPLIIDVTDLESITAAARTLEATLSGAGLYGLVNNAGIAVPGPLECLPLAQLDEQLRVNVVGQVAITQALLPLLRRGRGRVVFVASEAGRFSVPMLGAYSASKYALEALADALRVELRGSPVRVVVIEPGIIDTPIWSKLAARADELLQTVPRAQHLYERELVFLREVAPRLERLGTPAERVARAIQRALSARRPRARYRVGLDAHLFITLFGLMPSSVADFAMNVVLRGLSSWGVLDTRARLSRADARELGPYMQSNPDELGATRK